MLPPAAPSRGGDSRRAGERPRRGALRGRLVERERERLADAARRRDTLPLRRSAHAPAGCGMSIGTAEVGRWRSRATAQSVRPSGGRMMHVRWDIAPSAGPFMAVPPSEQAYERSCRLERFGRLNSVCRMKPGVLGGIAGATLWTLSSRKHWRRRRRRRRQYTRGFAAATASRRKAQVCQKSCGFR